MNYIQPHDRYQYTMMNNLDDEIRVDHPVRIIDLLIDKIVYSNPERFTSKRMTDVGPPEYHPTTLLKLYVYGYFNGIKSSRKLEVETHRNKEVMWLLGGLIPDHWTISQYRKEHGDDIKFITKRFREFLSATGYIAAKRVAIDGTKVKANTNREMFTIEKIEKRLEKIEQRLDTYLNEITTNDRRDDVLEECETSGKATDDALAEKIVALQNEVETLRQQKTILEAEHRNYISNADRDARLMKSRDGFIPAYNVQFAVDEQHKLIVDSEVTTEETDNRMLPVMVQSIIEEIGKPPEEISADKGYYNAAIIEEVEEAQAIACYIPERNKKEETITFAYNAAMDAYICSEGKPLVKIGKNKKRRGSYADVYQGKECGSCIKRTLCTTSSKGRILHRYKNKEWTDRHREKMKSDYGGKMMTLRKSLVEHPFGTIKCWMGKIPLLLRGKANVSTEINLYTTGYNLKRLLNIETIQQVIEKISTFPWQVAEA